MENHLRPQSGSGSSLPRVPGYTPLRSLGSGASGQVVLARHEATGTRVAIKHLSRELHADEDFVRRFRDEARLLETMRSSYVVRFHEYLEMASGAAIVMEVVEGVSLRSLLRKQGSTSPEAALLMLKGSLLGLADAHAMGVVHRDYKPENVLVDARGGTKLVDFGIAVRDGERTNSAGTAAYMAPEQWHGRPASPATDVYAAAATLFECLTGEKPYTGSTLHELALRHVTAPIPVAHVPKPLQDLVRLGLAKNPEERPQSAQAFVAELDRIAEAEYGKTWEDSGRGVLASLVALLSVLLPGAHGAAAVGTDIAATSVGADGVAHAATGFPWSLASWAGAAGAAAVATAILVTPTQPGEGPHHRNAVTGPARPDTRPGAPGATASGRATSGPTRTGTPAPSQGESALASSTAAAGRDDPSASAGSQNTGAPNPGATGAAPTAGNPSYPSGDARVESVDLTSFYDSGVQRATATVTVTTTSPDRVFFSMTWSDANSGSTASNPGPNDGMPDMIWLEGKTRYQLTYQHQFTTGVCGSHWGVLADSGPNPLSGRPYRTTPADPC